MTVAWAGTSAPPSRSTAKTMTAKSIETDALNEGFMVVIARSLLLIAESSHSVRFVPVRIPTRRAAYVPTSHCTEFGTRIVGAIRRVPNKETKGRTRMTLIETKKAEAEACRRNLPRREHHEHAGRGN